ncbi:hypothetical protein [Sphingomonas psychrotolerans]|uniref:ApeA N-terminal domain-containing protein n=1 Tax=Sphingomonas psychrotolerans TaxID=1327635 RepID=A0A2K8MM27_9SPHN|nr:hypothetical protein [Sphingomonas psychrotolerans]ATY34913.1 hypothetical protein CVN68_22650 [Sphingomonas psychrotolerans]
MPILDPIRFQGTLSQADADVSVGFTAGIDDDGNLTIALDPITPARAATPFVPRDRPLDNQSSLRLEGASDDGWRFSSETFHLHRWSHPEGRVEIEGGCGLAEFSRDVRVDHNDMRAWFFRKLATIHGIERQTPLGRLVFTGYREGTDQEPRAVLAIHARGSESQSWWDQSERFLIHLERVLSLACDVYLVPIYEQRVRGGVMTLRVVQRGRTSAPYMAPFDLLFMWQIFDCAVCAFEERPEAIERLDPAIRWMTAPVAYQESRLINAMSALESIIARSGLPELFLDDPAAFHELKKRVRKFLKADPDAPSAMGGKVGELNRRSLRDKLDLLLGARGIYTEDLPTGWLTAITAARNVIVHTGVAPDQGPADARMLDHIVWAREIVTRIILDAIGFEGQYQSWLHRTAYLSFPGCRPITVIAAEQAAATANSSASHL